MEEFKIKKHAIYTYETEDGRDFDDLQEAQEWQGHLEAIKDAVLLDSNFKPTTDICSAFYVHIKTCAQLRAFAALQAYEGFRASIADLGCWYYDESADQYLNIEEEINRLKDLQLRIYEAL